MRLFIKTLIVLVVASVAMSCSVVDGVYNWGADQVYKTRLPGYTLMTEMPQDWYGPRYNYIHSSGTWKEGLGTWDEASKHSPYFTLGHYLRWKVSYKADVGPDQWSSPQETLARGYGDCDDYSVLFLNLIYILTGEKFNIVLVDTNKAVSRAVVDGGYINHAIVEAPNGQLIEPQWGYKVAYNKIGFRYTFHEVFNK